MKKIVSWMLCLILVLSLCGCSRQDSYEEKYNLGMKYLGEEAYEEAVAAFSTAIKIDKKQAPAYVGRADAYTALAAEDYSYYEAAEADYRQAIALDDTDDDVYRKLANVYITEGKTDEAREILADRNIELEETTDQAAEEDQTAAGGETAGGDSADASAPVELGAELNKFLSKVPCLIREDDDIDWFRILWSVTLEESYELNLESEESWTNEVDGYYTTYSTFDGKTVDNVLQTYYGTTPPEGISWPLEDYCGSIDYKDGKYYTACSVDLACLEGIYLYLCTDLTEKENGVYLVSYTQYWVEPGYMTYDEDNYMLTYNEDGYYDYTVEDAENDKFCEKRDEGQTLVRRNLTTGQLNIVLDR